MAHIVVKRYFENGLTHEDIQNMLNESSGCFGDWGVDWIGSYQSLDGKTFLCHYEAADADSVRFALRQARTEFDAKIWTVSNHLGDHEYPITAIVGREFDEPADFDAIAAQEEKHQSCLDLHGVKFVRTFFSLNKKNMFCLYHAPDAESVRIAQQKASMPVTRVWGCEELLPEQFGF